MLQHGHTESVSTLFAADDGKLGSVSLQFGSSVKIKKCHSDCLSHLTDASQPGDTKPAQNLQARYFHY